MNPRNADPIEYFNEWFVEPIVVTDRSVVGVMEALSRHPVGVDETSQDYFMPKARWREEAGRFRIYGENQDGFYCFVYEGDEGKIDPPVYFEGCGDLTDGYEIDESEIIDGDHVLAANTFSDFLWYALGHDICIRSQTSGQFAPGVTGIYFEREIRLDDFFVNRLGRKFPDAGYCFVAEDVVCIPDWGAGFRTADARHWFLDRYAPNVLKEWSWECVAERFDDVDD